MYVRMGDSSLTFLRGSLEVADRVGSKGCAVYEFNCKKGSDCYQLGNASSLMITEVKQC